MSKVRSVLYPRLMFSMSASRLQFPAKKHHLLVQALWSAPGSIKQEEIVAMHSSSFNCPSLTLMLTASVWCIFVPLHLIRLKMHLRKYCCLNHPSWLAPGNIESPLEPPDKTITTNIEAVNPVSEAYGQWLGMVYHCSHEYTRYTATNFMASSFYLTLRSGAWHRWWWSIPTDQIIVINVFEFAFLKLCVEDFGFCRLWWILTRKTVAYDSILPVICLSLWFSLGEGYL